MDDAGLSAASLAVDGAGEVCVSLACIVGASSSSRRVGIGGQSAKSMSVTKAWSLRRCGKRAWSVGALRRLKRSLSCGTAATVVDACANRSFL